MANFGEYTLTAEWVQSANGKYTFARKGRNEFFIKEMSSPIFPDAKILPEATCKRMKKKCEDWMDQRKDVVSRVHKASKDCKYIVAPTEMLVENRHIYIVSPKVKGEILDLRTIAARDDEGKRVLIRRFTEALVALQKHGIVHGDLKHTNVFVVDTSSGMEPRFIDFDDSYVEGKPPTPDSIIGSPEYYSPELGAYIVSEDPDKADTITCKSDIFAAGIMFHEYLTGVRPTTGRYKYPFQIKRDDEITPKMRSKWQKDLIKTMMKRDYTARPDATGIMKLLNERTGESTARPAPRPARTDGARSSSVVEFIHTPDGRYFAKGADGTGTYMPEFAAKSMSKRGRIPIREGEAPYD